MSLQTVFEFGKDIDAIALAGVNGGNFLSKCEHWRKSAKLSSIWVANSASHVDKQPQIYLHVNKRYLLLLLSDSSLVLELISWKHSFRRLSEESEMAIKKKQALENLVTAGRISRSTFDVFNNEIDAGIAEIERERNALLEKMESKTVELGERMKTLEMLLANLEIQHVTGEVEEEKYQQEIDTLSTGLESTKHELETLKDATSQLSDLNPYTSPEIRAELTQEPERENREPADNLASAVNSKTQNSGGNVEEAVQPVDGTTQNEQKQEA